jgi:hypothetical protein
MAVVRAPHGSKFGRHSERFFGVSLTVTTERYHCPCVARRRAHAYLARKTYRTAPNLPF